MNYIFNYLLIGFLGLNTVFCFIAPAQKNDILQQNNGCSIKITNPKNNDEVCLRPRVEGTFKCTTGFRVIKVIVHPVETNDYWVQQNTVIDGSRWSCSIECGRNGDIDNGKGFEVRAFLNPREDLRQAQVNNDWPDSDAQSNLIYVTRK
jgi:hypothetical protein